MKLSQSHCSSSEPFGNHYKHYFISSPFSLSLSNISLLSCRTFSSLCHVFPSGIAEFTDLESYFSLVSKPIASKRQGSQEHRTAAEAILCIGNDTLWLSPNLMNFFGTCSSLSQVEEINGDSIASPCLAKMTKFPIPKNKLHCSAWILWCKNCPDDTQGETLWRYMQTVKLGLSLSELQFYLSSLNLWLNPFAELIQHYYCLFSEVS